MNFFLTILNLVSDIILFTKDQRNEISKHKSDKKNL